MKKVCVIITARPSYSRIKSTLVALKKDKNIKLSIILSGSALLDRYGKVSQVINDDGFSIDFHIHNVIEGSQLFHSVKSVGLALIDLSSAITKINPDLIITIADRYETIANAIASSYMNIPLLHIQGGELTGSIDNKVRHAITKLADVHFVATEIARERVISMGEDPKYVFKTGCPSLDLALQIEKNPLLNFDPFERYQGTGPIFDYKNGYLVVMQHPVTTEYDKAFSQANKTIQAVKKIGLPVFWFWPNVDAGSDATSKALRIFREFNKNAKFHFFKNLLPKDFLLLVHNSSCLVGNSSVGIRECSFLGIPVVNIGSRQNGRERANNVIDVSHDFNSIFNAIKKQISHGKFEKSNLYGNGKAGEIMANLISSKEFKF